MGCYADLPSSRDLNVAVWENDENTSVERCVGQCYELGYLYAGLQVRVGVKSNLIPGAV